jgi:hypothetical protein
MFSFLGIQTLRQLIETKDFKAIGKALVVTGCFLALQT